MVYFYVQRVNICLCGSICNITLEFKNVLGNVLSFLIPCLSLFNFRIISPFDKTHFGHNDFFGVDF